MPLMYKLTKKQFFVRIPFGRYDSVSITAFEFNAYRIGVYV